jgi:hypothetical protein
MKVIVIDWYGPYADKTLENEGDWGNGLYIVTGKQKYQREPHIQYCGYTTNSYRQRFSNHHKIPAVTREREYWLSEISHPKKVGTEILKVAESIIIYFWEPELNEKGVYTPPEPTTIVSRWYKTNNEPRYRRSGPIGRFPDIISWDGELWRTGKLDVFRW